jgi:GT2 family glycosyltransferase
MTCWSLPSPVAYICLGKHGDIIQLLPAFLAMYEKTGQRPVVVVAQEFATVLEGVTYVKPWPMDVLWNGGGPYARRQVEAQGFKAVCPIWWNDAKEPWLDNPKATTGTYELHSHGHTWKVDASVWPDYGSAMWDVLGFDQSQMENLPLVFDNRDAAREEKLVKSVIKGKKPVILYNFTGIASPFPAVPEVVNRLLQISSKFQLVDLGKIRCHRIYDLLGLYDVACGLLTSDTSTLHLAPASRIPYVAFTQDGWSGSRPKGNWKGNIKYIRAVEEADVAIQIASRWSNDHPQSKTLIIRRTAALGDVLAATAVAKQAKGLGFKVIFQSYNLIHNMLRRSPFVDAVAEPVGHCDIDLDGAYETNVDRTRHHFHEMFMSVANKHALAKLGTHLTTRNCSPVLVVTEQERNSVLPAFTPHPKPWVVIGPRSNNWANRTIPDETWGEAAKSVKGTCFWLGSHANAPAGIVDLQVRDVEYLIKCISVADQFVGVDSGPMHMAAALAVPVLAVEQASSPSLHLTDQRDFVVTAEEGVFIPAVQDQSGKVRIVVKNERRLGYGRNTNYGARHSVGKYLLLLNDDVFLEPDAVGKLLEECSDAQAGVVAHFLTYPNGTIYHAGKVRAPGVRGWGHIDHRKYIPTIQEPCEMENVCGASVLVRRKAFYDIRGFDEDFFVYAEDDDFMLRMRREGWKIRYTPHARGIHMEHQSTQELGNINDVVGTANRLFGKKWGSYFDHNLHRIPGTFDYLPR